MILRVMIVEDEDMIRNGLVKTCLLYTSSSR